MPKSRFAREFIVEDHLATAVPVLERRWYYEIEVDDGVWTNGLLLDNVHATRTALRNMDVRGAACLDIGCMEGLVSILLERRGAAKVVAYDRWNLQDRIHLLKERGIAKFDYHFGFPLSQLHDRLRNEVFDVVIFSGVLYHMIDPLGGLLTARSFLKPGGIMVFESLLYLQREMAAQFNASGALTSGGDNFWLINVGLADYLLRFARLKPLDVYHLVSGCPKNTVRVCVVCEALAEPIGPDEDSWIRLPQRLDLAEYLDLNRLQAAPRANAYYAVRGSDVVLHPWGSADVFRMISERKPLTIENRRFDLGLSLSAQV
jgi:SAM-dependent methyltransferase